MEVGLDIRLGLDYKECLTCQPWLLIFKCRMFLKVFDEDTGVVNMVFE